MEHDEVQIGANDVDDGTGCEPEEGDGRWQRTLDLPPATALAGAPNEPLAPAASVQDAPDAGPVVIDMTDVAFLSSAGLGVLVAAHRDAAVVRRVLG